MSILVVAIDFVYAVVFVAISLVCSKAFVVMFLLYYTVDVTLNVARAEVFVDVSSSELIINVFPFIIVFGEDFAFVSEDRVCKTPTHVLFSIYYITIFAFMYTGILDQ